MDRAEFLRDENWQGSYYELCLQLGRQGDDARAAHALRALWVQPQLRGPWLRRDQYGCDPTRDFDAVPEELYGSLVLPDGIELGCMTFLVRVQGENDWFDLSVPVGMLEAHFPVRYPLTKRTNKWLSTIELALAELGAAVYQEAGFVLGSMGEEASGARSAEDLTTGDCERGGLLVPELLWRKLAPRNSGIRMPSGLVYAPANGPEITFDAG